MSDRTRSPRKRPDPAQLALPGVRPRRRVGAAERAAALDLRRLRAVDAVMPNATAVEHAYRLCARVLDEAVAAGDEHHTAAMSARRLQEIHAYLTGHLEAPPTGLDPFALSGAVVDTTFP